MARNFVTEVGMEALVRAPFFPSLTTLVVDLDAISPASQRILREAAASCPGLEIE